MEEKTLSRKGKITVSVIAILVLTGGVFLAKYIAANKAKMKEKKVEKLIIPVSYIESKKEDYQIQVKAHGIVTPAKETLISSRVSGEIISVHDNFILGGRIKKGEVILAINPIDAKTMLVTIEANLLTAKSQLDIELGLQEIAEKEYEMIDNKKDISDANKKILLRVPQLETINANIKSIECSLKKAKYDYDSTKVLMPFDGIITAKMTEIGERISGAVKIAKCVSEKEFFIKASISELDIKWLDKSEKTVLLKNGSKAKLIHLLPEVEKNGLMASVLLEIENPLEKNILLGSYQEAFVLGKRVKDVVLLKREYLRSGDKVWTIDSDNKLRVKPVTVVFKAEDFIVIRNLEDGEKIITSDIATPVEGNSLRVVGGK